MTRQRLLGCLLGGALGDALGAPHEGGFVERLTWRLIGKTTGGRMRWTDDTAMTLDVAASLAELGAINADDLAGRFAASYRWSRGYGPGAARVLQRIGHGADYRDASRSVYPEGSFGNGGAMRAPIIGVFHADRLDDAVAAARLCASVTHAHPLGLEGAGLLACATSLAARGEAGLAILRGAGERCRLEPFTTRLGVAESWIVSGDQPPAREVRRRLGNGIAASESCVTAVYLAARFLERPFTEMIGLVIECGGDTDTIGAMAGGVWGTANGAERLPEDALTKLEDRERIEAIGAALYDRRAGRASRVT